MILFFQGRITEFLLILLFFAFQVFFILQATKKKEIGYIRHISGLDAIGEIVGRATEMGKPIHLSPGVYAGFGPGYAGPTVAALSMFSHVSSLAASKKVPVLASVNDAASYAAIDEAVRVACESVHSPECYKSENIQYYAYGEALLTGVFGTMTRMKPAGNFLIGPFGWDAVVQGELGAYANAMQLGGTDAFANLSMLAATCDFLLIGEEMFAAGAYVSKDPKGAGALRGQDLSKVVALLFIIVGAVLWLAGNKLVFNILGV